MAKNPGAGDAEFAALMASVKSAAAVYQAPLKMSEPSTTIDEPEALAGPPVIAESEVDPFRSEKRPVAQQPGAPKRKIQLHFRLDADLVRQVRMALIEDDRKWQGLGEELVAAWLRRRSTSRARGRGVSDGGEA